MVNSFLPFLIAAAVVGILHMSAPDHWVTLSLLGRTVGWTRGKLFGVSLATALGHVILSVILGLAVVFVGLAVSSLVSLYLTTGIGSAMVLVGLYIGIRPLIRKEEAVEKETPEQELKNEEERLLRHEKGNSRGGLKGIGYFAVLGAALSPDLSITPVFLSAVPSGFLAAIDISVVFAIASILTLIILVQLGAMGLAKTFERVPEKYNDSLVGFVIAAIGIYIIVAG
jgi:cadmium resistance protein CadD (predicted permease)